MLRVAQFTLPALAVACWTALSCSSESQPPLPAGSAGPNSLSSVNGAGAATSVAAQNSATPNPEVPGASANPTQAEHPSSSGSAPLTAPTFVVTEEEDPFIVDPTPEPGPNGELPKPRNLGTELDCDGVDDNSNGVIDDVDVGKDGLCDCINMGFFGQIASDAGNENTAFEAWLEERSGEVPIKHLGADEPLTAEWLASLQVLIVGGLQDRAALAGAGPAFTSDEIAAFDDWLQNRGAGVFTLSGYTSEVDDARPLSELLANTGLGYQLTGIPGAGVIDTATAGPPAWLEGIVAPDHPSVEGVTEIGVFYGYPVTGDGTVILSAEGYDLAIAKSVGNGRAFVFADEWITQDTTWAGTTNGQANPCQQPCNEQENICRIATQQCAACELQPCSDPAELDAAMCEKGCQGSCDSETARCEMYTQQCSTCSAAADERAQQTPRLWLNTIRWLTPVSECQVEIPRVVQVR